MTQFYVNHADHAEVTSLLQRATGHMGNLLESLNGHLRGMHDATTGQAVPLWQEHQTNWNKSYHDMHVNLHSGTNAAASIGETFAHGDRWGAQIML